MAIGAKSSQDFTSSLAEKVQHLGSTNVDGGVHPHFGTRNFTPPPQKGHYMKVVYSLDYPTTEQAPWSQVARNRTNEGGGLLTWVHEAEEIPKIEKITITGTDQLSDSWFKMDTFGGSNSIHFKFVDPSAHDDECGIVANHLTIPSGVVRPN